MNYSDLYLVAEELLGEFWVTNLANLSALIMGEVGGINWAGFYLVKGQELFLGPFQGKPACQHIPFGKGVCGTAAMERRTVLVPDVHLFPGHIACDPNSRSEIVVPLFQGSRVLGVLDIDAPTLGRFTKDDQAGLERLAGLLVRKTVWPEEF